MLDEARVYRTIDVEFFERSVDEFVRRGEFDDAVEVVRSSWPALSPTHGDRLRATIESIPSEVWSRDPWMLAGMGASYRSVGSRTRSAALPWFRSAEALIEAHDVPVGIVAGVLAHHGAALRSLGQLDDAAGRIRHAWSMLETDTTLSASTRIAMQAQVGVQAGLVALQLGDLHAASSMLRIALGLAPRNLTRPEVVETLAALAFVHFTVGDLPLASEFAARARQEAAPAHLISTRFGVGAMLTESFVAALRGERVDAEEAGLVPASEGGEWAPIAYLAEATACMADGRHIEGLDRIRRAIENARTWQGRPLVRVIAQTLRGELLMHLGEFASAISVFESIQPDADHSVCPARFIAGIRYKAGDSEGCLAALADCMRLGESHSARTIVDVLVLEAAAGYELDRAAGADVALDRGLLLAEASGMRTPFSLVAPTVLQRMLSRAVDRHQPSRVHRLLSELSTNDESPITGSLEPLSERERDIARHLFDDKTVGQIASELYISTNTVKTHVRAIYRKLSANNRQDAVRRVRELGIDPRITPR